MGQDSLEKTFDLSFALERLSIISDGNKPDEDDHKLSAVCDLKPKVLLAIDKLLIHNY